MTHGSLNKALEIGYYLWQEDGENLLRGNRWRLLLPQRIVGNPRATCWMHFSHQIFFASPKEISSVSFSHKEFQLKLGFISMHRGKSM
jgi:hypothetical protein